VPTPGIASPANLRHNWLHPTAHACPVLRPPDSGCIPTGTSGLPMAAEQEPGSPCRREWLRMARGLSRAQVLRSAIGLTAAGGAAVAAGCGLLRPGGEAAGGAKM